MSYLLILSVTFHFWQWFFNIFYPPAFLKKQLGNRHAYNCHQHIDNEYNHPMNIGIFCANPLGIAEHHSRRSWCRPKCLIPDWKPLPQQTPIPHSSWRLELFQQIFHTAKDKRQNITSHKRHINNRNQSYSWIKFPCFQISFRTKTVKYTPYKNNACETINKSRNQSSR